MATEFSSGENAFQNALFQVRTQDKFYKTSYLNKSYWLTHLLVAAVAADVDLDHHLDVQLGRTSPPPPPSSSITNGERETRTPESSLRLPRCLISLSSSSTSSSSSTPTSLTPSSSSENAPIVSCLSPLRNCRLFPLLSLPLKHYFQRERGGEVYFTDLYLYPLSSLSRIAVGVVGRCVSFFLSSSSSSSSLVHRNLSVCFPPFPFAAACKKERGEFRAGTRTNFVQRPATRHLGI